MGAFMKKIEQFLGSGFYIATIFLITFISWSFYQDTPPYDFNLYNMLGVFFLILMNTLILIFYKNTLYILPSLFSLLFVLNKSNMNFDTVGSLGFPYLALFTFFIGPVIHLIRFKPKFNKGIFFLGILLIGISYILPLIYLPFDIRAIPVSMMGILYLLIYIFFTSTVKGNLNYLFKVMMFINLLMVFQVFFYLYQGYMNHPELEFYYRIFSGWGRNLGWANINDMCFYIALTFPSYLYFIFKKPKTYLVWFLMILPVVAVILSKSRGGVIGFAAAVIGVILFFWLKGNKKHLTHGLVFLAFTITIFYIGRQAFHIWYEFFLESLGEDFNDFTTGRITIYKTGWEVFKTYPIFGGGWLSLQNLNPGSRLFMYHSTLFQALAAMGTFGLIALMVHYFQVFKYMVIDLTLEKSLFLIGYIASQVHGLIDNVQYAVPYSVLIVIFLAVFETSTKTTSFELINRRYHFIEANEKG
jgi:O-antigen ligase